MAAIVRTDSFNSVSCFSCDILNNQKVDFVPVRTDIFDKLFPFLKSFVTWILIDFRNSNEYAWCKFTLYMFYTWTYVRLGDVSDRTKISKKTHLITYVKYNNSILLEDNTRALIKLSRLLF